MVATKPPFRLHEIRLKDHSTSIADDAPLGLPVVPEV